MWKSAVLVSGAIALLASSDLSGALAADLKAGARVAKAQRVKVVHDPCRRARDYARNPSAYNYDGNNLVYVHGNSYRAGFCIDGDTGPAYRAFWAWGY